MAQDDLDDPPALFDFLEQFLGDLEGGAPRSLDHYLVRFPDDVEAVTKEYRRRMQASQGETPPTGLPTLDPAEGIQVGPYRLITQLARGGQGTVYLAEDTRIARRVALKILTTLFSSIPEGRLRRFRREAEVISKLDHPGICGVFDADLEGEIPYLAMRYVEGQTLADLLAASDDVEDEAPPRARTRGPVCRPETEVEFHRTLEFFEDTARAMQAAHEEGVVHRDIKPSNLMVNESGSPVILDFGLAHDDDADSALTQAGDVFGTPAYMAPEQIAGRVEADPRTDVYALGVVLYECLALERPFSGPTREALYHSVATGAVLPVRTHNAHLPREIEVVLAKALEKDPARRYASASELGEDLRRVRGKVPIRARPAGPVLRLRRWAERHPVVAAFTIGTLLLLGTGLAVSTVALRKVRAVNERLTASILGSRSLMLKDDDPTAALLLGIESATMGGGLTSNMALLAALASCRERRTLTGHTDRIADAELVGDRGWVITASADATALVFELETGRILARLEGHDGVVTALAAAPDPADASRTLVVTAGKDGTARLYRLKSDGRPEGPPRVLAGHTDWVRAVALDPRGELLVSASNDGTLRLYRTATGELLRVFDEHTGAVTGVTFSADGGHLLSASGDPSLRWETSERSSDHTARLFEVATGKTVVVLSHPDWVVEARLSPDGRFIATACEDGAVRVQTTDGSVLRTISGETRAIHCSWSPDGSHLIAGFTGFAKIWSASGDRLIRLGERGVHSGAFSPDGKRVVTGGFDNTAHIWDVELGTELATLTPIATGISECFWTPDGARIVTSSYGLVARVWYADTPPGIAVLTGHGGPVMTVAFDPTGERVLSASQDGTARIWSRREGSLLAVLDGHAGQAISAVFDPRGELALTASNDGTARVWDADTGRSVAVLEHDGRVRQAEFSPTGETIVSVAPQQGVLLWTRAGEPLAELDVEDDEILAARFSGDGRRLATCSSERIARVFSVPDGTLLARLESPGEGGVFDVRFVPGSGDGRVATASEDGFVRIWDLESGTIVAEAAFTTPGIIDFSPSGDELLVAHAWGGVVTVLDGALGGAENRMGDTRPAHEKQITAARFSPSGQLCVTASRDGTASLWDATTGTPLAHFEEHVEAVLDACFSPDGAWIATASRDATVRIWPVDPLPLARERQPRKLTKKELDRYADLAGP